MNTDYERLKEYAVALEHTRRDLMEKVEYFSEKCKSLERGTEDLQMMLRSTGPATKPIRYFYIISWCEEYWQSIAMSFEGDFNLVAATQEMERRMPGSILMSWQEISEDNFNKFCKHTEGYSMEYRPKLAIVSELKAPPVGVEPIHE